jgi:mono/diheme cytochrome c family protein
MVAVNIMIWLALAALAVFLVWLAARAWRSPRWYVRWPGTLLSSLLTLLVVVILYFGAVGMYKLYVPVNSPVQPIQVSASPEMIARGEHLANVFCVSCHSPNGDMPLIGGLDMSGDIPIPLGAMVSVNLTPAGPLKDWSDGEILRALRQGLDRDGRRLMVMNVTNTRFMSDDDLMAVIAYLRNQPAIEHETPLPPDQLNFLGVLFTGAGIIPDPPVVTGPIIAPEKAATVEYGEYILSYQDCRSCHGNDLLGGDSPLGPNAPGLRTVRGMSQDQFIAMMRTGVRPNGLALNPPMPWQAIGRMDDVELAATYQYLISIP